MDDEEFDSEHCLLVKIDPPMSAEDAEVGGDENFNCLEMYMENIADDGIQSFRFNGTRSYAIVKFVKPISGIKDLQKKSDGKPLLKVYKITLEKIPLVDRVLVTDLPSSLVQSIDNNPDLKDCELVLYFENRKFCPDGGDVESVKALSCHHAAVVQFADQSVARKLKGSYKLNESHFTVRPLNIFEFVEGPCCSVCCKDKVPEDIAEDTTWASWHSPDEDTDSQKKETRSDSRSNSDTDEDIDMLKNWHMKKEDANSQSQNEYSSLTSEKYLSSKKSAASDNSEINRTRKVTEYTGGFEEVDLYDYTVAAQKLNDKAGRKWIAELLDDLKIPAELKYDKSYLNLRSNTLELATEAAKTVACSLLPARIKCDQNKMSKCSKILQNKTMHVIERSCKSGYLELLGIPMDVIRAVGEIEKLHGSRW